MRISGRSMSTRTSIGCSPDFESAFVRVADICAPLDWGEIFPVRRPVHLDLGAGDGGFCAAHAARDSGVNVLAVERLLGRARKIAKKAVRGGLDNLRVLRLESGYLMRYLVPPGTVAVIHLMHPDPWPKRRHWKHRLVDDAFAAACARALEPGGEIRLTIDHPGYLKEIVERFDRQPELEAFRWLPGACYPRSDFEAGFAGQGKVVFRQGWRRLARPR